MVSSAPGGPAAESGSFLSPATADAGRSSSRRVAADAGQVVPLAAALMVLVVTALVALVPAVEALTARARASTAADAAALAGAAEGEAAARRLAAANGAELVEFRREGEEVVVRVRVGAVEAEARARGRLAGATTRPAALRADPTTSGGHTRPLRSVKAAGGPVGARLTT